MSSKESICAVLLSITTSLFGWEKSKAPIKLKHNTTQPNITICEIQKINNSKRLVKPFHILDWCIDKNYNIID
jgi:hypothetical protein